MYTPSLVFKQALQMGLGYLMAYAFAVAFVVETEGVTDQYARQLVTESLSIHCRTL